MCVCFGFRLFRNEKFVVFFFFFSSFHFHSGFCLPFHSKLTNLIAVRLCVYFSMYESEIFFVLLNEWKPRMAESIEMSEIGNISNGH